jgi:hypothetical protein
MLSVEDGKHYVDALSRADKVTGGRWNDKRSRLARATSGADGDASEL